jgi:hypothetical protein
MKLKLKLKPIEISWWVRGKFENRKTFVITYYGGVGNTI